MEVEVVFRESGILALAGQFLCQSTDDSELCGSFSGDMWQVQSDKFDKGLPKAAWTRRTDGEQSSPDGPTPPTGRVTTTNGLDGRGPPPYRTGSAFAFIRACALTKRVTSMAKASKMTAVPLIDAVRPMDADGPLVSLICSTYGLQLDQPNFFEQDFLPTVLGLGGVRDRGYAIPVAMERN